MDISQVSSMGRISVGKEGADAHNADCDGTDEMSLA